MLTLRLKSRRDDTFFYSAVPVGHYFSIFWINPYPEYLLFNNRPYRQPHTFVGSPRECMVVPNSQNKTVDLAIRIS